MAKLKQKKENSNFFQIFLGESVKSQQKHTAKQYQKKLTLHEVDNEEHMV